MHVEVYSDAEEVELLLDGESVGRERVGSDVAFRADFELVYAPGTLTAVSYTEGAETGRCELSTATGETVLSVEADRHQLNKGSTDLAFIDIVLTDQRGVFYTGRDRVVEVTVDGPGVLQAFGSADLKSEESFSAQRRMTCDGRALAVVRPTGVGRVTVTVRADGCAASTVTLESELEGSTDAHGGTRCRRGVRCSCDDAGGIMISYVLRRLGTGFILILVVTTITFFLTYSAKIPVAINLLGANAEPAQIAALNAKLGLDQPVVVQYGHWLQHAIHGDFGRSYFTSQPVGDALLQRLPVTLSVVVLASIIVVIFSVVLGVVSAARGGLVDGVLQGITTIAFVFPGIVLGIVLVLVFAVKLHWVPATGYVAIQDSPGQWFSSVILPAIVLSVGGIAALAAQIRGSVVDELSRDYIKTLRSRGVSERAILLKHALRNAASPGLTTFSLQFISLFGAALFIEKIFALPGYGTYAFTATIQGDLPAMMGVSLFGVGLVVVVNLVVDVANGWLNPKARVA